MLPEQAKEMLRNYRASLGRCKHIEVEIERLRREAERIGRDVAADVATNSGAQPDGMPRGTAVGNPTERMGLMLASGYKPDAIVEIEAEIAELEAELGQKRITVRFVEAWMQGLTLKQRWMVEHQFFDGMSYAQMNPLYRKEFGEPCSKYTLRRLSKEALSSVFEMAK